MKKVVVDDKVRIVRKKFIREDTKDELSCTYKKHNIWISRQKEGDFYVQVTDQTGSYLVMGGYGERYHSDNISTIEDCLAMCIKQIL